MCVEGKEIEALSSKSVLVVVVVPAGCVPAPPKKKKKKKKKVFSSESNLIMHNIRASEGRNSINSYTSFELNSRQIQREKCKMYLINECVSNIIVR